MSNSIDSNVDWGLGSVHEKIEVDEATNTRKKLCYFRLPPNLAHRKSIDLANYVPSSRPWGVLSFTQRFFQI